MRRWAGLLPLLSILQDGAISQEQLIPAPAESVPSGEDTGANVSAGTGARSGAGTVAAKSDPVGENAKALMALLDLGTLSGEEFDASKTIDVGNASDDGRSDIDLAGSADTNDNGTVYDEYIDAGDLYDDIVVEPTWVIHEDWVDYEESTADFQFEFTSPASPAERDMVYEDMYDAYLKDAFFGVEVGETEEELEWSSNTKMTFLIDTDVNTNANFKNIVDIKTDIWRRR
jgi:hypothetical protein